MYLIIVVLLMLVLPVLSTLLELPPLHILPALLLVAGKWFVFWGVGVRVATAGLRQILQPAFTARQIFKIESPEVLPIVTELGIANLALGAAGIVSAWRPSFVLPVAFSAAIFYGIAGLRHARDPHRSFNQNVTLVSDLFAAAVLIACLVVAWRH